MENLHLKNLNKNNIKHTKATIKYALEKINIKSYKIENFKQKYIKDLYNPLNDTKHLREIGQQMIDIFNIIKDFQNYRSITNETLHKLKTINENRLNIEQYGSFNKYIINYSKGINRVLETDYNFMEIDIDINNTILLIN
jgi:hypothetical protein